MGKEIAVLIPIVIIIACALYLFRAWRSKEGKMIRKVILSVIYIFIAFFTYNMIADRIPIQQKHSTHARRALKIFLMDRR